MRSLTVFLFACALSGCSFAKPLTKLARLPHQAIGIEPCGTSTASRNPDLAFFTAGMVGASDLARFCVVLKNHTDENAEIIIPKIAAKGPSYEVSTTNETASKLEVEPQTDFTFDIDFPTGAFQSGDTISLDLGEAVALAGKPIKLPPLRYVVR